MIHLSWQAAHRLCSLRVLRAVPSNPIGAPGEGCMSEGEHNPRRPSQVIHELEALPALPGVHLWAPTPAVQVDWSGRPRNEGGPRGTGVEMGHRVIRHHRRGSSEQIGGSIAPASHNP